MNENVVILIANILSVVGNALFTLSAIPRNKTTIITMQTSNHFLSSVAQLLTSAYSGMVQDVVCLFKNVVLIFVKEQMKKTRLIINIICIVLALCVGITLNILLSNSIWYGFLPVISTCILSTCILIVFMLPKLSIKMQTILVKGALIVNAVCWGSYGIFVKLYPITIFNGITFIISIISIISIFLKKDTNNNIRNNNGDKMNINDKVKEFENDKDIILIDVRTKKEYEEGHIPNAILIELDKIEDIVDIISDKNKKIYLYCRSGRRSQIAADIVNKLGYINAINIGGILDYKGKII